MRVLIPGRLHTAVSGRLPVRGAAQAPPGAPPRAVLLAFVLAFVLAPAPSLLGQQPGEGRAGAGFRRQEGLSLAARLEAALAFRHSSPEGRGYVDFPLHGNLGARYRSSSVTGLVSLDLDGGSYGAAGSSGTGGDAGGVKAALGPTYLRGGEGDSYLQAGYFTVDWGTARSVSVVQRLNLRDPDYPPNLFHAGRLQPNPMFVVSFGGDQATQVALSRPHEEAAVEDVLVGLRAAGGEEGMRVSVGMVRPAGYPPPLFFLTAESGGEGGGGWMELGWWHHPGTADRVDLVLGGRRELASASLTAEFVLLEAAPLLYLAEELDLGGRGSFSLAGFVHLAEFSTALDAGFGVQVDSATRFDLGTVLFFGKRDSYFSRWEEGNDNKLYLRLSWEYGGGS
ncbi:MAG: hypothetical protein ACOC8N_01115 [Spirochaetota bacterium]